MPTLPVNSVMIGENIARLDHASKCQISLFAFNIFNFQSS